MYDLNGDTILSVFQGEESGAFLNDLPSRPAETQHTLKRCTSGFVFKLILWVSLMTLFVHIEFGAVFFVFSLFYLIYVNLGSRKPGEPSAYSVFNPDCEAIDGTLTAEQLERQLIFGALQHL